MPCVLSALGVKCYEEHISVTVLKVVLYLSKDKDADTLLIVV